MVVVVVMVVVTAVVVVAVSVVVSVAVSVAVEVVVAVEVAHHTLNRTTPNRKHASLYWYAEKHATSRLAPVDRATIDINTPAHHNNTLPQTINSTSWYSSLPLAYAFLHMEIE
jgi:hypothetical protein